MDLPPLSFESKITFIFVSILVVVLSLSYLVLFDPLTPKNLPDIIEIGAVLPLTGSISEYGSHVRDGIEMAVAGINENGGISGRELRVLYYDNGSNADRSVEAFRQAAENGCPVIIGAVSSDNTLAMAPLADAYRIVLISPGATTPILSGYSPWVFRTIASDRYKGRGLVHLVQSKKDHNKNLTVLYQDDAYGHGLYEVSEEVYHEMNPGKNLTSISFPRNQADFSEQIAHLKDTCADTVILFGYLSESAGIVTQAADADLLCSWFGDESVVNDKFILDTYPSSEGFTATLSSSRLFSPDFEKKFFDRYGYEPDFLSGYGYDTIRIVSLAIPVAGYDSEAIRDILFSVRDIGITGPKSFDKNGDIAPLFDVVRLTDGEWKSVNRNELAFSVDFDH
ncbi:MAG: ABC transporter substrate-binding protein [Methanospirillaceae archaeon]|nr:ABC transporter substrate-binding protein [Methanospirillaceae archaeon]